MLESYPREELSVLVKYYINNTKLVILLKFDQVISSLFRCNFLGKGNQEINHYYKAFNDQDIK